jgi:hypothetical protein
MEAEGGITVFHRRSYEGAHDVEYALKSNLNILAKNRVVITQIILSIGMMFITKSKTTDGPVSLPHHIFIR